MDPITHLALGACIGASCAPRGERRRGAIVGALLGELPDIDVVALHWLDPVTRLTYHRSATHSLLVLPFVALLAWLALRARWPTVREEPRRWLLAVTLALLSHAVLDAFTVYGTQLFWPLDRPPVMIGSIFVIDPLFTLPLLVGATVALRARDARRVAWWTRMALAFAAVYLGWTLLAKLELERQLREFLAAGQLVDAKIMVQPAPLQSLLWRELVVRQDGTWFEGYYSFVAGNAPTLSIHPSTPELLKDIEHARDVERLKWFTQGFYSVDSDGDHVVLTDLRMGMAPSFFFRYEIADYDRQGNAVAREPAGLKPWPPTGAEAIARVWKYLFAPPS